MIELKDVTTGDVIECAKLIKTTDWDGVKETTYYEKYYSEPFYEMFTYSKSYIINSIFFQKDVWMFLKNRGYKMPKFKKRD